MPAARPRVMTIPWRSLTGADTGGLGQATAPLPGWRNSQQESGLGDRL
ncbi:MAG: hypothetical protein OXR67_00640 [Chloroflexota bacterium]|nr:hypothetical protein [Chloroflexota bacterium]